MVATPEKYKKVTDFLRHLASLISRYPNEYKKAADLELEKRWLLQQV